MSRVVKVTRAALALLFLPLPPAGAADDRENVLGAMRREWVAVQKLNYEALERAPVRGWGDDRLQEPLRRIERTLRDPAPETDRDGMRSAAARAYDEILGALSLRPLSTLSPTPDGLDLRETELLFSIHRDVPSALVFRILPSSVEGDLSFLSHRGRGITVEGEKLTLTRHFATLAVLPVVAAGDPGTYRLPLRTVCAGAERTLPLRITVVASGVLKGTVVRRGDDGPLAAKLFVEDPRGRLFVVPGEPNYRTQSWYAFLQPRFSYVEKSFSVCLPEGKYRVTAMKGYGYRDWSGAVEITPGEVTERTIEMKQLCPLEEAGWYAGDLHVHGTTTLAMLRAEDVNVAVNCHYSSDRPRKLTLYQDSSDPSHLSTSGQEIEHWNFGNAFYFGIPTTVQDPETPDPRMTPFFHYDEQCHRMGGITLRWLRSRPFSPKGNGQQQPEIAVSAALGYMDVWSVLDNSMQNLLDTTRRRWTGDGWRGDPLHEHTYRTWYGLLNCGIRIPAAAGTSYGRLSRLGFNRVYARCRGELGVDEFAAALKRGDGFVTNGPLLWLRADGNLPGEGLQLDAPGDVTVSVRLSCRYPIGLIQLLQNGKTVAEKKLDTFDGELEWEEKIHVAHPSWLAARCFGTHRPRYPHSASHNHFAHTNPLFVTVQGKRPHSRVDATRFVAEIDALIEFAPNIPAEALRARALEVYKKAKNYFAAMCGD